MSSAVDGREFFVACKVCPYSVETCCGLGSEATFAPFYLKHHNLMEFYIRYAGETILEVSEPISIRTVNAGKDMLGFGVV